MITKITMNGVASYKHETSLTTDKPVNLVYGLNGVGKTTLSNYLYERDNLRYQKCSIEGLQADDKILVYNQNFVNDNFYEAQNIQGIFSLSKENKSAKQRIDIAKNEIARLRTEQTSIDSDKKKLEDSHHRQVENYRKEAWKIKTNYTGGDRVLEYCLDGFKGSMTNLFNHLSSLPLPEEQLTYTTETLKSEVQELQRGDSKEAELSPLLYDFDETTFQMLLSKAIVGNRDSSVAELIENLGNSDWVGKGLEYVHIDNEVVACPFCQQKTITQNFVNQIRDYFDESYKKDLQRIQKFKDEYSAVCSQLLVNTDRIAQNRYIAVYSDDFIEQTSKLRETIELNISHISDKIDHPSTKVSLINLGEYISAINNLIDLANKSIEEFNVRIDHINETLDDIKDRFWKLMRKENDSLIKLYEKNERKFKIELSALESRANQNAISIIEQEKIVKENQGDTNNIDEAVDNIKAGLIDIGIDDFTIEKYSEEEALYRLVRTGESEDVFKSLSEGEKMVISFLYFIELCKGESQANMSASRKIVVIDDPISSLSHIYVFNIGRLIGKEFLYTDSSRKYEQVFVLTHSLYFFYEIVNAKNDERHKTQKLFRICKNSLGSTFVDMKYEEIQNDYQAYWHVIKDSNQSPALIANCMRNIIEYFFNFVEKTDLNQMFARKELQEVRFQAFNRYMNRESHSKGDAIFDIKEFDYDSFRDAFKALFQAEGYINHYNRMMR